MLLVSPCVFLGRPSYDNYWIYVQYRDGHRNIRLSLPPVRSRELSQAHSSGDRGCHGVQRPLPLQRLLCELQ